MNPKDLEAFAKEAAKSIKTESDLDAFYILRWVSGCKRIRMQAQARPRASRGYPTGRQEGSFPQQG